jgi:hypothetical protein
MFDTATELAKQSPFLKILIEDFQNVVLFSFLITVTEMTRNSSAFQ